MRRRRWPGKGLSIVLHKCRDHSPVRLVFAPHLAGRLLKIVKSLRIIALHGNTSSVPVKRGRGARRRAERRVARPPGVSCRRAQLSAYAARPRCRDQHRCGSWTTRWTSRRTRLSSRICQARLYLRLWIDAAAREDGDFRDVPPPFSCANRGRERPRRRTARANPRL